MMVQERLSSGWQGDGTGIDISRILLLLGRDSARLRPVLEDKSAVDVATTGVCMGTTNSSAEDKD